jgi:murein DD-endopeptidase MepM/ murein hydrolase activator NlpD
MIDPPYGKPWGLYGLLAASLSGNLFFAIDHVRSRPADAAEPMALVEAPAAPSFLAGSSVVGSSVAGSSVAGSSVAPVEPPVAAPPPPAPAPYRVVSAPVEHSLARTFAAASPEDGDVLSALFARVFMWDLDLNGALQKGDHVEALFAEEGGEPVLVAARLQSARLGRTLEAFRYQAPGDAFPSYWRPEGDEAVLQIVNGPLATYDQVTSLLRDRPTHRGMDFKTPVGTDVRSPKAGTVTRTNWNVGANGDCVEVRYGDGVLAKFLHLQSVGVRAGQSVAAGAVIGTSGNTGHSTAPHLHYQLDRGERALDPVDYHGTARRTLPAEAKPGLDEVVASVRPWFGDGQMALR